MDVSTGTTRPRTRRRWRWVLLTLLLLALGGTVWWYVTRPAPLRLIASAECLGTTFSILNDSLIEVREDADQLTVIRSEWDGNIVWRIEHPLRAGETVTRWRRSPNGRYVAALVSTTPGQARVATWEDGTATGNVALPRIPDTIGERKNNYIVSLGDDGLVFALGQQPANNGQPVVSVLVLARGRITARGTIRSGLRPIDDDIAKTISSAGEMCCLRAYQTASGATNTEYYRLSIHGASIITSLVFANRIEGRTVFMAGHHMLSEIGEICDPHGRVRHTGEAWESNFIDRNLPYRGIVQSRFDSRVGLYRYRMLDIYTGATWPIPTQGTAPDVFCSLDGRVAACLENFPQPRAGWPKFWQSVQFSLPAAFRPMPRVAVYTPPGRLRACLWFKPTHPYWPIDAAITPDGRTLVVIGTTPDDALHWYVYRW